LITQNKLLGITIINLQSPPQKKKNSVLMLHSMWCGTCSISYGK